ncbi:MAG: hypothetical protein IOMNBAOH_01916 [Rhodocyclaceae bacterium]|jgi:adenylate cyclase|nr:hypothetical protein [Rhodocyclaceae bacterium]
MSAQLALPSEYAVLFADLTGSTSLYERMGDGPAFMLVKQCLDLMQDVVTAGLGRVVKITGDGIMAAFTSAEAAADAAVEIHRTLHASRYVQGLNLGVRIGFHYGPVVESDTDLFGDTVNLASRMAALAVPGKIMITRTTASSLRESWRSLLRPGPRVSVKGFARPIELVELLCDTQDELTNVGEPPIETPSPGQLRLYLKGQTVIYAGDKYRLHLGRDKNADLRIVTLSASRLHAEIELRNGKFVLIDASTNGTYLTTEGEPEIKLCHEEATLRGHGWLCLGEPRGSASEPIEFFCL